MTHTVGRTQLDEVSARRRNFVRKTQQLQRINIHAVGGIRIRIRSKRVSTDPLLDRAATGIGLKDLLRSYSWQYSFLVYRSFDGDVLGLQHFSLFVC